MNYTFKKNECDDFPRRKNIRLKNWSYNCGAYFLTICTKERKNILSSIDVGAAIGGPLEPVLTNIGKKVKHAILNIENIYKMVLVDKFVIMPNHIHMILIFKNENKSEYNYTVPKIVNKFKGYVTKLIGEPIWQKLFFDRVIRDEKEYLQIWKYIDENPLKWTDDMYFLP